MGPIHLTAGCAKAPAIPAPNHGGTRERFARPKASRLPLQLLFTLCALPAFTSVSARPYDGKAFQGRIAWSADGNHNDPDDWIASPIALGIFASAGLKDRLVHFDYNCILPQTNAEWERIHEESVLGAARRYGYDSARFFDCRKRLDEALADLRRAIDASSEANPLYFIIAGPMEVPYRAIQQSDPAKRKFVTCISHSRWNDGFASQYKFPFTKRSVIEQDVHWLQIPDQNRLLAFGKFGTPAKPEEFAPYFWLRDSANPVNRWLWERMVVSTRPDPSDAGMAWFLATGDEECTPQKLRAVFEDKHAPPTMPERSRVRLEAENFRHFEQCALEDSNDRTASHRLAVRAAASGLGTMRTRFDEPFAPARGNFNVEVRYWHEPGREARYTFAATNTRPEAWESSGDGARGWQTRTLRNVALASGDEITVTAQGPVARVDYVQLNSVPALGR